MRMPVKVKICGITQYEDAKAAVSLGVDAIGFIFYPKSPRAIHPLDAKEIIKRLPPFVSKVGVFVDETAATIMKIVNATGIDTVQLHGKEPPSICDELGVTLIKAFPVGPDFDLLSFEKYKVSGYLLDTWNESMHGGSGKTFDWSIANKAMLKFGNVILAGGLGPSNIREALEAVHPYAVEFNSGVEIKPGIKNPHKMRDAVTIVKNWK
jgi:phosphoribosylanthranilate isomerase